MVDLRSAALPPPDYHDHVRGPRDAPLVIVYADFSCPHCAATHAKLGPLRLRVLFRHFALRARGRALALAHAAEAAAEQERFWEMHDALMEDPGHLDDPHLWQRARALGLDLDRFERDRRGDAVAQRVRRDLQGALRAGVGGTPTLFTADRVHRGTPDSELLSELAQAAREPRDRQGVR